MNQPKKKRKYYGHYACIYFVDKKTHGEAIRVARRDGLSLSAWISKKVKESR